MGVCYFTSDEDAINFLEETDDIMFLHQENEILKKFGMDPEVLLTDSEITKVVETRQIARCRLYKEYEDVK